MNNQQSIKRFLEYNKMTLWDPFVDYLAPIPGKQEFLIQSIIHSF